MDREAPHVGVGLEEVSLRSLRNLSSAPLGGAEGKLGGRRGGCVRLGAHAFRRYRFSWESNQGSARLRGPRSLGLRSVVRLLLSYLRHDVRFHDVGSHHEGGSRITETSEQKKATRGSLWKGVRSFHIQEEVT